MKVILHKNNAFQLFIFSWIGFSKIKVSNLVHIFPFSIFSFFYRCHINNILSHFFPCSFIFCYLLKFRFLKNVLFLLFKKKTYEINRDNLQFFEILDHYDIKSFHKTLFIIKKKNGISHYTSPGSKYLKVINKTTKFFRLFQKK